MNRKDTALLHKLGACEEAIVWCKTVPDFETAWNTCKRPDWMLWALGAIEYKDDKAFRLYACACVRGTPLGDGRTVWDLLTDKRSRNAVEVSERYAEGQATDKELAAARDDAVATSASWATRAAEAAAWSFAWASARDATLATAWASARDAGAAAVAVARKWQANKLREFVTWDRVAETIALQQTEEIRAKRGQP